MGKAITTGSPEQFMAQIENRIAQLSVSSSVEASDGCNCCDFGNEGDIYTESELREIYECSDTYSKLYSSFDEWVEECVNKGQFDRVGSGTNTCNVAAIPDVDEEIYGAAEIDNEYVYELKDKLLDEIHGRHDNIENIEFENDNKTLFMTVTYTIDDETLITDYEIPFDDLSQDIETIQDDADYIADQVDLDVEG